MKIKTEVELIEKQTKNIKKIKDDIFLELNEKLKRKIEKKIEKLNMSARGKWTYKFLECPVRGVFEIYRENSAGAECYKIFPKYK